MTRAALRALAPVAVLVAGALTLASLVNWRRKPPDCRPGLTLLGLPSGFTSPLMERLRAELLSLQHDGVPSLRSLSC